MYYVLPKCVDYIMAAFMYCLGNIPIGYEEIWYLSLLLSQKKRIAYTLNKVYHFHCLTITYLKIPDLEILWHP